MLLTLSLLSLISCNKTPQSVIDGQVAKDQLEESIQTTVSAVTLVNPVLGEQSHNLFVMFHNHFAPLVFEQRGRKLDIKGHIACRDDVAACFGFGVPHHGEEDRNIGGWMDGAQAMLIDDALPATDNMAPLVALHELKHAEQFTRGMAADPPTRVAGERWPREREATEFEIELERAVTNGRFDRVVSELASGLNSGTLHTVTYGNVVYPALDGRAEEILPGISPIGTDLLNVSIIYAFNVALMTDTSEEARDRTISTLQIGLTTTNVHELNHK